MRVMRPNANATAPLSPYIAWGALAPRHVRPAGWSDASTAGVLGAASSALGSASAYLSGDRQLDAWQQSLALQQSAAGAQATASAARVEGAPLVQSLRERLLREAATASSEAQARQARDELQRLAQLEVQLRASLQPPGTPAATPEGRGGSLAVAAAVVLALAAAGGAVAWAARRRGRRGR